MPHAPPGNRVWGWNVRVMKLYACSYYAKYIPLENEIVNTISLAVIQGITTANCRPGELLVKLNHLQLLVASLASYEISQV